MTKILTHEVLLLKLSFFYILPSSEKNDKVIVFRKPVVTPSKIRTVINFYAKALKRFPEKGFHVHREFSFHWSNYIFWRF